MELYRISQEKFAEDLSGNGARIFGGRWNSEGLFALYASASRSLALLETLAHTPAKMLNLKNYILLTLTIPDSIPVEELDKNKLTPGWDAPDTRPVTKRLGDRFLRSKSNLLLSVPSVLMPEENNFLINSVHPWIKKLKILSQRRITFDARLTIGL
ncbi:MAG: RES family NAD+ phosphorylase [Bacteroidetes bacterium]|nr:RES family NAD+ phosphorylase [Bacteroidota bacterium]MBS1633807.1 RES family NAD+ phosphorylase [Bacteroidota bacterium]